MDAENVVEYTEVLRTELPPAFCIEYLHGKMKPEEKNEIMERFLANEIQVLVSTTVIEVGVNVPNATVMMVENSERFGLAQLHQLRGRVGRGGAQSYCIFLHKLDGKQIRERLDILCKSNVGFEIANRDMPLRGPGDLFVRQKAKTAVLEESFFFTDVFRCKHIICTGQNRNGTFTVIFQIDVGLSGFAGFISANSGGGDIFFVQHVENQACVIIISDGSNQMSVAV